MKQNNLVGWFEIYVEDIDRAVKFYQEVLGVQMVEVKMGKDCAEPTMRMFTFPIIKGGANASGALVYHPHMKPAGNSVIIYFHSDDCSIEESRIEKAGGKIFMSKFSTGENNFISWGVDTEGNMFGLHSWK